MEWDKLLSLTIRLTDAYDSSRRPGGTARYSAVSDRKRHNATGLWFEVAVSVLECLQGQDDLTPGHFVPRETVFREIRFVPEFADVSEADIDAYINLLATPCDLSFLLQRRHGTLSTALVERAVEGTGIRLSSNGKMACYLAYGIDDWIYADIQAYQLTKALGYGKFGEFCKYADRIIGTLRNESHNITRMRELPGAEEKKSRLLADQEHYIRTIRNTGEIVLSISRTLETDPAVREKLRAWLEDPSDASGPESLASVRGRITRLRRAVEVLHRNLVSLIRESRMGRDSLFRTVDFYRTAQTVVRKWESFSESTWDHIFLANGFWWPKNSVVSVSDLIRPEQLPEKPQQHGLTFRKKTPVPREYPIIRFLKKHREEMAERIRQGPIALSEIIEREQWDTGTVANCALMIGVLINPGLLGIEKGRIAVIPGESEIFEKELADGQVRATRIELVYIPPKE
ncbi:hypothetical protein DENIS_4739 [Desulfonema ishimotonii]|uniref:Uncharacterized protein n=1 Tax=Desulfonema ishimotonii TaxID=45657 RepID=A0A401G3I8_9BACT|nr:hypothetical protein [Desulfonema ishimotonii]GBC63741.1 hypothetical protein DENIS_4739 [Desulfonema ishimotonii]